jgi:hypothetical protein
VELPQPARLPARRQDKAPSENDLVMGTGRGWLAKREEFGCPLVWNKSGDPLMALRTLIAPALAAGYSEAEIKWALMWADRSVPTADRLEAGLVQVRRGWRPSTDWKPGDARFSTGAARRPSTTDARVNEALALADKFREAS